MPCFVPLSFIHHVLTGLKRNPAWMETFSVQFLGSVEVPHHQGNGILCAAMQKVRNKGKKGRMNKNILLPSLWFVQSCGVRAR